MKLLAGLFALAFACLAAPALAEDGDKLMKVLDFEELREIAEELDYVVTEEGVDEDGDFYFEIESDTGLVFHLYGASCDDDNPRKDCAGLNAVGSFTLDAEADVPAVMGTISFAFMKVYRSGDEVKISRYVIFDGGITRENLKENVRVFAEIGDLIWGNLTDDEVLAN
jgi:hypothetical protein